MARKTNEELEVIKKKYKVDNLWSWSRFNCYSNSSYEYFLKYVAKIKEDNQPSIYLIQGGGVHNILEDFYDGKIEYKDMIDRYENLLFDLQMADMKYNRNDEEANFKIGNKYETCVRDFFNNHQKIKEKIYIEKFITIDVKGYIFQGYIDFLMNRDGICYVGDWKTSTIYTGEKRNKEMGQLKLYALGLHQLGVPIEKIKIGWNFLKYKNIIYKQKNGNYKIQPVERNENIFKKASIYKNVVSWLKHYKLDESLADMCELENSFDCLPEEIRDFYKVEDCYDWEDVTKEMLEEFKDKTFDKLNEIIDKTDKWNKQKDLKIWWEEISGKDDYYYYNLCGYSRKLHLPFNEYLERNEMFLNDLSQD